MEVVLKALLKSRCEIYCSSVHGACYSVMEGRWTELTQLLPDKFMLTVLLVYFLSLRVLINFC